MKTHLLLFLFVLTILPLSFSKALADEMICLPLKPSVSGADELRMHEAEFKFRRAIEALNFLQTDVYEIIKENDEGTFKLIRENKVPKDMPLELLSVLSNERFYISYPNSITIIKGTLLKYQFLYLREKMNNPDISKKALKIKYEKAKEEFCNFVAQAEYVD